LHAIYPSCLATSPSRSIDNLHEIYPSCSATSRVYVLSLSDAQDPLGFRTRVLLVWGLEHVSFGCMVTFGCVTVVTAQLQPWCPLLASHPETLYEPLCHHCDVCSIATIVASISTQSIQLHIATIVARTFVAIYNCSYNCCKY
jgi:hypothetical protein